MYRLRYSEAKVFLLKTYNLKLKTEYNAKDSRNTRER